MGEGGEDFVRFTKKNGEPLSRSLGLLLSQMCLKRQKPLRGCLASLAGFHQPSSAGNSLTISRARASLEHFCLCISTGQCQYCQHVNNPWRRCGR